MKNLPFNSKENTQVFADFLAKKTHAQDSIAVKPSHKKGEWVVVITDTARVPKGGLDGFLGESNLETYTKAVFYDAKAVVGFVNAYCAFRPFLIEGGRFDLFLDLWAVAQSQAKDQNWYFDYARKEVLHELQN